MASRDKRGGVLFSIFAGPTLTGVALAALWINETRFDYHRAAADARVVASPDDPAEGERFALTGPTNPDLTFPGEYVERFRGYLVVWRDAEIRAWDRDKDSDDNVTWQVRWMDSVESNSRNSGLRQTLRDERFGPQRYVVGDLFVEPGPPGPEVQFVDSAESIAAASLDFARDDLTAEGEYAYLRRGKSQGLGDERVSYTGVPAPEVATYFGCSVEGRGVADVTERRSGWLHALVMDTGVLHHLVVGDRATALATMKSHLRWLKWTVRGIGTAASVLGVYLLASAALGALFPLPFIGRLAAAGAWLLALAVGLPLALGTMALAYLVAHPFLLASIVVAAGAGAFWLIRRGRRSQRHVRAEVAAEYGRELSDAELKEEEFLELARVALTAGGGQLSEADEAFLRRWAARHGWGDDRTAALRERAATEPGPAGPDAPTASHLKALVRLVLADGTVTGAELKAVRSAARRAGLDESAVRRMVSQVRTAAA